MINKSIKKILSSEDIKKIVDLNFNLRPENISPDIYYKIAEIYENK